MINLGLIGCGRWGVNFIKTIKNMNNVQIAKVYSSNIETVNLFPDDSTAPEFYDYRANGICETLILSGADKLDGLIIATPPATHKEIINKCLYYGIPFLCEKPLCDNLSDTYYICKMIDAYYVPCMIDYTQLYNPAFMKLKESVKNEKIFSIKTEVLSSGPYRKDVSMFWDWLPHDLSMIYSLGFKPDFLKINFTKGANPNSGIISLDDKQISVIINNVSNQKLRLFEVTTGNSWYNIEDAKLLCFDLNDEVSHVHECWLEDKSSPLTNVVNEFINVIKNRTLLNTDMTLWIAEMIHDIEKNLTK